MKTLQGIDSCHILKANSRGNILLNSGCVLQVTGKLKASHFFQPQFVLPYEGGLYLETSKLTAYQELLRELKK